MHKMKTDEDKWYISLIYTISHTIYSLPLSSQDDLEMQGHEVNSWTSIYLISLIL